MEPLNEDQLQAIAESAMLSGALEAADESMKAQLAADPEWTERKYHHVHTLLTAFVYGIIAADPWHRGYRLPPDFEGVVNFMSDCIQRKWPGEAVPQISLLEWEAFVWEWAPQHPSFRAWNVPRDSTQLVAIVHRFSDLPDERDFIDLDALVRNSAVWLRNDTRRNEQFDYSFEEREKLREQKDLAYTERNQLVAALTKLFPASLERHPEADTEWEDDWRWIVFIDLPAGQASWHIHDSELENFEHLPKNVGRKWDGHTTAEKYTRLAKLPLAHYRFGVDWASGPDRTVYREPGE
ncbi:MAG: hypothetical protein M0R28_21085 [Pigmentiphaga sp.]|nr:hypothetical protein [Pigmentiphaga sp.]